MVRSTDTTYHFSGDNVDPHAWLKHLIEKHHLNDTRLIESACALSELTGQDRATETGESYLQQGLAIAEILADLKLDQETLAAAIILQCLQHGDLNLNDIKEQLGEEVAKLADGVMRMNAINTIRASSSGTNQDQTNNLRKMLIAMVDDIRVVMIKLSERLAVLRSIDKLSDALKKQIATEAMEIYAPLANRLGIGQIKWEMEDYAFRYLQPEQYKETAKGLQTRRIDRDQYVTNIVDSLQNEITKAGITNAKIYGRSKHIHSIYRKMQRKHLDLKHIYDATAVRVLVPTVEDCYKVLSIAHGLWKNIPEEFDDYISYPKPNGYRSLHTAVHGPDNRDFEVQIRTHDMHALAELGVAAHWRYKEGNISEIESHERKIEWLRQVMDWQKEVTIEQHTLDGNKAEFIEDSVYVFTPNNDIIDLPRGSTPLDFAYAVHSEVGHRCRGAKIDGNIVPLTYQLKTGERVEILTTKQGKPSRDWLNPHLGYLKTSRAKAKIHHWFKMQDFSRNLEEGKTIFENEIRKLNIKIENEKELAQSLNFKTADDMFASLGRGELRLSQILGKLKLPPTPEPVKKATISKPPLERSGDFYIEGVGNLLTRISKCCQPLPGDSIVGYITQGRGISIHRRDCPNILHASTSQQMRFIEVQWGERATASYAVDISIDSYDRKGLLNDITSIVAHENANVITSTTQTDKQKHLAHITLTVELNDLQALSRLLDRIRQLPNIIEAKRVSNP